MNALMKSAATKSEGIINGGNHKMGEMDIGVTQ